MVMYYFTCKVACTKTRNNETKPSETTFRSLCRDNKISGRSIKIVTGWHEYYITTDFHPGAGGGGGT